MSQGRSNVYKLRGVVIHVDDPVYGAKGDDATDDTAAIQAAITAAAAGTTIEFTPGKTYRIGSAGVLLNAKTRVHLRGNGAKIRLTALIAAQVNLINQKCAIKFLDCDDCSITGFDIDGGGFAHDTISFNSSENCLAEGNVIHNAGVSGVVNSLGCAGSVFKGNRFYGNLSPAGCIRSGHYNADNQVDTDVLIADNLIDCNSVVADGIVIGCVHAGVVSGNRQKNGFSGIIIAGATGRTSKDVTITGNTWTGNSGHGIQFDVIRTTDADVPVGIVVVGNTCYENGQAGIYAITGFNVAIVGNTCRDNGTIGNTSGIVVDELVGFTITGNSCFDTRAGGARTQENGIDLVADLDVNGLKNGVIAGNLCRNNSNFGIRLTTVNLSDSIDNVAVVGNVCVDNGITGLIVAESAAVSGSINKVSVVGNICQGNTTSDMRVDPLNVALDDNLLDTVSGGGVANFSFANGDTTPSVKGARKMFRCANTGATTITAFDDGYTGQIIEVWFTNANTTINNGGNFILRGGLNLAPIAGDSVIRFLNRGANLWMEIGRNF